MTVVVIILVALLFFVLILLSIGAHEFGHLIPGKIFGVKTTEYFIGFGKKIWSFRKGETEYGIKAIPLGGYTKLVGMYPPKNDKAKPTKLKKFADEARAVEYETITEADEGRLFYQKPTWQKLIVMLCGPFMNILLAFLIFLGINLAWGRYTPQLTLQAVSECVSLQHKACAPNDPVSPAKKAGLRAGDKIISFNGKNVEDWDQLTLAIRNNFDREAVIVYERAGKQIQAKPVHTVAVEAVSNSTSAKKVTFGVLGIQPEIKRSRYGITTTFKETWSMSKQTASALFSLPVTVWQAGEDMLSGKKRSENSPMSIVGASRIAGEVAVQDKLPLGDRIAVWFMLLGSLNLFVGIFNLVPLLPLDGGHMLGAIYEKLKRLGAKLIGRPDPGPFDTAKMLPIAYVVGGFLLIAGVVLILADVINPLELFKS